MSVANGHFYRFGEFAVDTAQKVLLREGRPLPLTPKVFDTLRILVENSGRIVEKEELMDQLWPDSFVEESNLHFNIQQLRRSLGDNARRPVYIETVARRGYRFIAPVTEEQAGSAESVDTAADVPAFAGSLPDSAATESPGYAGAKAVLRSSSGRWLVLLGVAIVLIAGLGAWLLRSRSSARPRPAGGRVMLAVLPFENLTGDAAQEYFSDGLTEEMIAQLGSLDPQRLGVIARASVMHYKNGPEPLDRIGHALGVQYVLEGSVRRDSDKVRISAQLIKVADQTQVWARQYDRELSYLLSLQAEIAQEVADEIQVTLGGKIGSGPASHTSSPPMYEAYDLYLKGEYFWNKRTPQGLEQAIDYFQQATARDSNNARAYAGLADAYALIGGYSGRPQTEFLPKASAAALRALELDANSAEAHTALALIVQNYDWDWQNSEKEFRRAIESNPNYATAHHWYAEHLMWQGRFDEALRESERARQLDPLSLIIAADKGAILYYSRQYDGAIEQFRAVRELDPDFPRAALIVFAYAEKGLLADALADVERHRQRLGDTWYWSQLAYLYGRSGQQVQTQSELEKLEKLNRLEQIDPAAFVWAYVGMGNKDQALAWLEKAYAQHSNVLTTLRVEPAFDGLRGDRRFQDLLRRVGLSQ
jgi:TolB-like protein/DNA-binding winged helix-turn-helix (wHTH) protein/Tfp pilus assembly protein PilF